MTKDGPGPISESDFRQIIKLVEALDRSNLDSLQLDAGHYRLTLGRGPDLSAPLASMHATSVASTVESSPPMHATSAPSTVQSPPKPTAGPLTPTPAREKQTGAAASSDTIDVRSPIMGLFYSKPDPGSAPFVTLGIEVEEGTTVGLVEVMKVFSAIQAGAKGRIAEICVEDSQTVEIGQTLFRIRATTS